jgi:hypothetical protein
MKLKGPQKAAADSDVKAVIPATVAASKKRLFLSIGFLLIVGLNPGRLRSVRP